jgi:hypothetical protein
MYAGIANVRGVYYNQQWSRVQMFLVFNTVALPIVLGTGTTEFVKLLLSFIGYVMHVFIIIATFRANSLINYLDRKLAELEMIDNDTENIARVKVFADVSFVSRSSSMFSGIRMFSTIAAGVVLVWFTQVVMHFPAIFR